MHVFKLYDPALYQEVTDAARKSIEHSLDILDVEKIDSIILDDLDPERIKTIGWNH